MADSQEDRQDANLENLDNLRLDMEEVAAEPEACAIQYNKRDAQTALPVEALRAALNPGGWPEFEAVATRGVGVFDTLRAVTRLVLVGLRAPQTAGR